MRTLLILTLFFSKDSIYLLLLALELLGTIEFFNIHMSVIYKT